MRLVTIKVVADFLMIKQSTIYSWVHNGSIPFHKLNGLIRFDMDEIEAWVITSRQTQCALGPVVNKTTGRNIDKIVRNAIDDARDTGYNTSNGKPGRHQGLRKED